MLRIPANLGVLANLNVLGKDLRFLRRGRAVGLDVGSGAVKALVVERRPDGLVVSGMGAAPVEDERGSHPLAHAIHTALAKARVDGEPVIAAVGGPQVLIRRVTLPPLPADRILPALEMQHRDFGLLAPPEAILDAQILRRSSDGSSLEVLAVCAPRALVEERRQVLQQAAVKVKILDLEPLALLNGVLYLSELEPGELLVAVVVGRRTTVLCLFSEDGPVVARYLDVGAEAFTERLRVELGISLDSNELSRETLSTPDPERAEQVCRDIVGSLAEEIRVSLAFYRSEYDRDSLARYVLGGWMGLPELAGWLDGRLGLGSTFELMDPLQTLELEGPRSPVEAIPAGPEFLQAFGLALRGL